MTLKSRLLRYIRGNSRLIPKGELLRLVAEHTNYTSENAGRRLRELENEGHIEVVYKKNHAHYQIPKKRDPRTLTDEELEAVYNSL